MGAAQRSVEQVFSGGKLSDLDGNFVREAGTLEDTGCKGKVASVKHELGACGGCGLDAQAAEHGIGFPAAKQHDSFCANIGTEKGGGTARTEGTGSDLFGEDTRVGFVNFGRMLDCVGDVGGLGQRGPVDGQVSVLCGVDGCGWLGARCHV